MTPLIPLVSCAGAEPVQTVPPQIDWQVYPSDGATCEPTPSEILDWHPLVRVDLRTAKIETLKNQLGPPKEEGITPISTENPYAFWVTLDRSGAVFSTVTESSGTGLIWSLGMVYPVTEDGEEIPGQTCSWSAENSAISP